jgi:hypothetical protein
MGLQGVEDPRGRVGRTAAKEMYLFICLVRPTDDEEGEPDRAPSGGLVPITKRTMQHMEAKPQYAAVQIGT